MSRLAKLGLGSKEQRAWALYDWGNSAFATIMMTAVLPIYYADVLAADLAPNLRTAYWGYTSAIAMAIIALQGPIMGAYGDLSQQKKPFIILGTVIGMVFSVLLALLNRGDWLWASVFFIMGNLGYALAEVFYDSLLPFVASDEEADRVSTAGYAVGYLGGGLCLVLCLALIQAPTVFGLADGTEGVKAAFCCVALWWGLFTIPLIRVVKEPKSGEPPQAFSFLDPIRRNIETLKSLPRYKNAALFLLAFWAYSDGIGTVIKMATIYGKEVGIGTSDLIGAIVMVQFLGVPFTFAFGTLAQKWSAKGGLMIALVFYTIICGLAYFLTTGWQFWLLAFLLSMVQGASQALSRSLYMRLIPKEKSGEFYGFYAVSSRFAGILGPLFFAIFSQVTSSSRTGLIFVVLLFFFGMAVLSKVDTTAR